MAAVGRLAAGSLYEIIGVTWRGQTVGKAIARLRVVDRTTLEVPSLWQAVRRVWPYPLVLVPILGTIVSLVYWWPMLWRADRRGSHDLVAATVVISADY